MPRERQRFLIVSGINGHAEALLRLQAVVRARHPDGLLFAGGVLPHDGSIVADFDTGRYRAPTEYE